MVCCCQLQNSYLHSETFPLYPARRDLRKPVNSILTYTMEDIFEETPPNSRIIMIAYDPSEDELCACAEACHVDREMIDIVSQAHPEQQRRMESHLEMGSYMETLVFKFDQKPNPEQKRFLTLAFEAVRFKNCHLRTRLVKYKEQVLQVVLSDKADWTEGGDFSAYKDQSRMFRMDYGSPLFRYALLEDKDKPTYFVWTGMSNESSRCQS